MYIPKNLITKDELEAELFQIYFKLLNRVNILIEINNDIKTEIPDDKNSEVQYNALLIMREKLEQVKAEYHTNTMEINHD
jgi:hypothetical protein